MITMQSLQYIFLIPFEFKNSNSVAVLTQLFKVWAKSRTSVSIRRSAVSVCTAASTVTGSCVFSVHRHNKTQTLSRRSPQKVSGSRVYHTAYSRRSTILMDVVRGCAIGVFATANKPALNTTSSPPRRIRSVIKLVVRFHRLIDQASIILHIGQAN